MLYIIICETRKQALEYIDYAKLNDRYVIIPHDKTADLNLYDFYTVYYLPGWYQHPKIDSILVQLNEARLSNRVFDEYKVSKSYKLTPMFKQVNKKPVRPFPGFITKQPKAV